MAGILDAQLGVHVFAAVLAIMDPIGNVPIFLSLTRQSAVAQRRLMALQATLVAGGVIAVFALTGPFLLGTFGISMAALRIAGGFILALVALDLFRNGCTDHSHSACIDGSAAFVPLGTPLLAGPGAIATTMVHVDGADGRAELAAVALALVAVLAVVYLALRYAGGISRVLRPNGLNLTTRLMGLITAAISVELVISGARALQLT